MSQSAVLKCRKAPNILYIRYIVINFVSFIDNVISLYSLSQAFICLFFFTTTFYKTTRSLIVTILYVQLYYLFSFRHSLFVSTFSCD